MNAPVASPASVVLLTPEQLERLLERAAETGAALALEAVKSAPAPGLVPASAMCARLGISRTSLHRLRADRELVCDAMVLVPVRSSWRHISLLAGRGRGVA